MDSGIGGGNDEDSFGGGSGSDEDSCGGGGGSDEDSCGGSGGSDEDSCDGGGSSPDGVATGVGVGSAGGGRTAGGGEGGSGMLARGGGGGGRTANSYQLPTVVTCRGCLASWVLTKVSAAGARGMDEGPCVLPFGNMAATSVITVSFMLNTRAPCGSVGRITNCGRATPGN